MLDVHACTVISDRERTTSKTTHTTMLPWPKHGSAFYQFYPSFCPPRQDTEASASSSKSSPKEKTAPPASRRPPPSSTPPHPRPPRDPAKEYFDLKLAEREDLEAVHAFVQRPAEFVALGFAVGCGSVSSLDISSKRNSLVRWPSPVIQDFDWRQRVYQGGHLRGDADK